MSIGTTVVELCEFKEEKNNNNNMDKNYFKKYCVKIRAIQLSFKMCCTVKSLKVEIKTEFSNVWGEYKYPYISHTVTL